jgi:hypothetical protein
VKVVVEEFRLRNPLNPGVLGKLGGDLTERSKKLQVFLDGSVILQSTWRCLRWEVGYAGIKEALCEGFKGGPCNG